MHNKRTRNRRNLRGAAKITARKIMTPKKQRGSVKLSRVLPSQAGRTRPRTSIINNQHRNQSRHNFFFLQTTQKELTSQNLTRKKNHIKSLPSSTKNGAEFDEQLGKQRFQFQNRLFPTRRRKMRTTWSSVRVVEVVGRGVEMERWAAPVFEGDFYTSFPSYLLLFLSFNLIEDL